jgi:predicted TIM-barrel fold metal-dependent hydrolase
MAAVGQEKPVQAPERQAAANREVGIIDSHIHLWDLPRSGPVKAEATGEFMATTLQDRSLFPEDCCTTALPFLVHDFMMSNYRQTPGGRRVGSVVLIEALPGIHTGGFDWDKQVEGNQWMLDLAKQDTMILSVVGLLNVTLPPAQFKAGFDKLKDDPRFVGIRVRDFYTKNPDGSFQSFVPNVIVNMQTMLRAGVRTFDVPEEPTHPTATVALAQTFASAYFVVNHFAAYGGHKKHDFDYPQAWLDDLSLLASQPNIYVKVSDISRWGKPAGAPNPYKSDDDAARYFPGLDAMHDAFGPDRLIWASNWPTSEFAGKGNTAAAKQLAGWREGGADTIELQLNIIDRWLETKGPWVRDKLMTENALQVYSPRQVR